MNLISTTHQCAIGLDLGQKRDHTAIAMIIRTDLTYDVRNAATYSFLTDTRYTLRHIERVALGTPFSTIAAGVRELAREAAAGYGNFCKPVPCTVVADATGVGIAVMELLRAARFGCNLVAVTITGGERESQDKGEYRVPKRDLILGLQLAVEQEKLEIVDNSPDTQTLLDELMNMRTTVSPAGNERFESWREGAHDDLVLAGSLAWWWMRKTNQIWRRAS